MEREALGVEFKNASVEVNFEEIEEFKKVAEKWHKRRQEKKKKKATTQETQNLLNELK
ncbi:hypothetical protein NIES4071_51820 [Calothrix sp. NIES-4071]|nr:hypothetical protein NIES4071_51820 [Calothrix sp. NIES-4071]BAZ59490.1 hypothetical protein NIES4105_51770 [Calothrix sp. NIES-4105]